MTQDIPVANGFHWFANGADDPKSDFVFVELSESNPRWAEVWWPCDDEVVCLSECHEFIDLQASQAVWQRVEIPPFSFFDNEPLQERTFYWLRRSLRNASFDIKPFYVDACLDVYFYGTSLMEQAETFSGKQSGSDAIYALTNTAEALQSDSGLAWCKVESPKTE